MAFNKNILRSVIIAVYIVLIALAVFGIGALYSYLNTGADRSKMLHTDIKKIDQYLPQIEWKPLQNVGRPMDQQTLNAIENDYLDAWYVRHRSYRTNVLTGVDDYFTKNARKNIIDITHSNKAQQIHIETTTLKHNPTLDFFSEDGQLITLTDRDVIVYKRIYKDNQFVLETKEIATYKIIMLLEDGFWRIRHMVREQVTKQETIQYPKLNFDFKMNGVNYYPQDTPWDMFGVDFSEDIIAKDFKLIQNAGLNTVRIFVPYTDFGKANLDEDKLDKLKLVLDTAQANNLKVMVTLFDFYGDYSVLDWTLNQRHAETIVTALKNHDALLAWDIKNEPDLDFESRGETNVMAWLSEMIYLVKSIDQNHPVTIGWSNIESAKNLSKEVDLISFHYYEDLKDLAKRYQELSAEVSDKPVAITEFGVSSYNGIWNPFGKSENNQANYHKNVQEIFTKNNMSHISWTLYDFTEIPKEVVGRLPWRKNAQKQFGFINKNGAKKASFKYISKE